MNSGLLKANQNKCVRSEYNLRRTKWCWSFLSFITISFSFLTHSSVVVSWLRGPELESVCPPKCLWKDVLQDRLAVRLQVSEVKEDSSSLKARLMTRWLYRLLVPEAVRSGFRWHGERGLEKLSWRSVDEQTAAAFNLHPFAFTKVEVKLADVIRDPLTDAESQQTESFWRSDKLSSGGPLHIWPHLRSRLSSFPDLICRLFLTRTPSWRSTSSSGLKLHADNLWTSSQSSFALKEDGRC